MDVEQGAGSGFCLDSLWVSKSISCRWCWGLWAGSPSLSFLPRLVVLEWMDIHVSLSLLLKGKSLTQRWASRCVSLCCSLLQTLVKELEYLCLQMVQDAGEGQAYALPILFLRCHEECLILSRCYFLKWPELKRGKNGLVLTFELWGFRQRLTEEKCIISKLGSP